MSYQDYRRSAPEGSTSLRSLVFDRIDTAISHKLLMRTYIKIRQEYVASLPSSVIITKLFCRDSKIALHQLSILDDKRGELQNQKSYLNAALLVNFLKRSKESVSPNPSQQRIVREISQASRPRKSRRLPMVREACFNLQTSPRSSREMSRLPT